MSFKAYTIDENDKESPIDMKDVKLNTEDEVRAWLIGNPRPGYLTTHPELAGQRMHIREGDN